MKNKFNIFDLFFGIKRKKEKIKDKEKKEKEKLILNPIKENKDEYVYPNITPTPFFNEETEKEKDKKQQHNNLEDEYIYTPISTSFSQIDEDSKTKKANAKSTNEEIKTQESIDNYNIEPSTPNITFVPTVNNTIVLQNAIIEQVEKLIKEEYYEIQKIKEELDIIEKQDKEALNKDAIDKLIDELNEIIKRFEKLKKEFYNKNYDKINDGRLDDSYINALIEDYKIALKNNDIENTGLIQIKEIDSYIDIINTIITIEEQSNEINDNLEDKKEELDITDKEIDDFQKQYTDIEKINTYIDSFSKEQAQIISDIKKKVDEKNKITKTAEYKTSLVIDYSKLLTSTLLMAASGAIPQTKTGNLLKIGLIVAAISGMSKIVKMSTKESKVTTKITSIDYSDSIKSGLSNINEMDKMISTSLKDIKSMKNEFQREFSKYKNIMPEYASMLAKLDSVEKELMVKHQLAKTYESKLNKTLEKNNVKVKRLEEEYFN